eukprot:jgi/Chrzof1/7299/Cz02g18100.t1
MKRPELNNLKVPWTIFLLLGWLHAAHSAASTCSVQPAVCAAGTAYVPNTALQSTTSTVRRAKEAAFVTQLPDSTMDEYPPQRVMRAPFERSMQPSSPPYSPNLLDLLIRQLLLPSSPTAPVRAPPVLAPPKLPPAAPAPAPATATPGSATGKAAPAPAPPAAGQSSSAPTTAPKAVPASSFPAQYTYLSNSKLRIGVDPNLGGTIMYLSSPLMPPKWANKNLINVYDCGRALQQSYYGCNDGSCWYTKPWRWNPVQCGSWQNYLSKVLSFKVLSKPQKQIQVQLNPRNWGGQELISDVIMGSQITLQQDVVKVRFSMYYNGSVPHPYRVHEVPAVFANRQLGVLAVYNGSAPWTGGALTYLFPGSANINYWPSEPWAAYVDQESGFGIGLFVPICQGVTAYRIGPDNSNFIGDCSYFAPTYRMAIKPGTNFTYDAYITTGRVDKMRETFTRLAGELGMIKGIAVHNAAVAQSRLATASPSSALQCSPEDSACLLLKAAANSRSVSMTSATPPPVAVGSSSTRSPAAARVATPTSKKPTVTAKLPSPPSTSKPSATKSG